MNGSIWLVGAGPMAREYARVLTALGVDFTAIGRGEASAQAFREACGPAESGGLEAFLARRSHAAEAAIVATGVAELGGATLDLLRHGVRLVLVEKPAALDRAHVDAVCREAQARGAEVLVGYNRRFYASTRRARQIITEDGGVSSFWFDFTEWSQKIADLETPPTVKANWLLANSSHVIDLAFYLGGTPRDLFCRTEGSLSWHPRAARFAGHGVSESGALFAYRADWQAPGRWGVELFTRARRIVLRPLETLQVQPLGTVAVHDEPLGDDERWDKEFKPGLYRQVEEFLSGRRGTLPDIHHQRNAMEHYERIAGMPGPA